MRNEYTDHVRKHCPSRSSSSSQIKFKQLRKEAMTSRRSRFKHSPGFYKALSSVSTADFHERQAAINLSKRRKLRVFEEEGLPADCYAVERVVSKRARKVRHWFVYWIYTVASNASVSQCHALMSHAAAPPSCSWLWLFISHYVFIMQKEYLVLWEGYSKKEASWVAEEDLTEAAIKLVISPPKTQYILHEYSKLIWQPWTAQKTVQSRLLFADHTVFWAVSLLLELVNMA